MAGPEPFRRTSTRSPSRGSLAGSMTSWSWGSMTGAYSLPSTSTANASGGGRGFHHQPAGAGRRLVPIEGKLAHPVKGQLVTPSLRADSRGSTPLATQDCIPELANPSEVSLVQPIVDGSLLTVPQG